MSGEPARAGASQRGGRCPRAGPPFLPQPRPRTPSLSRPSSCCHPLLLPARLSWAGLRAACRASFPHDPHILWPPSPCLLTPQGHYGCLVFSSVGPVCPPHMPARLLTLLQRWLPCRFDQRWAGTERGVAYSSEGARGLLFSTNFGGHMSNTPCCVTRVCT